MRLYNQLRRLKKEHNLHVYWYTGECLVRRRRDQGCACASRLTRLWATGKDQLKPLNAVHKSRNCHVS